MPKIGILFFTHLAASCLGWSAEDILLNSKAASLMILNVPAAVRLEGTGGCPSTDVVAEGRYLFAVQLRNMCPLSGSGLLDNYTVDRRTGLVWTGVDIKSYVDSDRLRLVREVLVGRGVKGNTSAK